MQLEVKNLSYKVNGERLINDVSFSSQANVCTALLGANGSGKTLLLRLCHGLLLPTQGQVLWNQQAPSKVFKNITMVFQNPVLLSRSARKNVEHALALKGIVRQQRKEQAMSALEKVGLVNHADQMAHRMSGGQRQRLALARALALKPSAVLLDEPTSGVDMESIIKLEDLIQSLVKDRVKVILTSHNPAQVKRLCDEVIFLDKGSVICHATKSDFFSSIEDPRIKIFIDSQTLL